MSGTEPGQAAISPDDLPAIAAFGAWIGQTETARILLSWQQRDDQADWRKVAEAVRTALAAREPRTAHDRKLGVALAALHDLSEAADGADAGTYGELARAALNEIEHLPW